MQDYTRPAVDPDEIAELGRRLRPADIRECRTVTGEEPHVFLPKAVDGALECRFFFSPEGETCGIFGLHPFPGVDDFGIVWLMATPHILKWRLLFHHQSKQWIERLHTLRPILGNIVDSRNALHLRWLKRSGFLFLPNTKLIEGVPFYEFVKVR